MTRTDTIARHLNQAGEHLSRNCIDAAMRCINAAFLEALGGAAVAGEANGPPEPAPRFVPVAPKQEAAGPWAVRATYVCVDGKDGDTVYASNANTGHTSSLDLAHRFPSREGLLERERSKWGSAWRIEVLPLAEAERMEAAGIAVEGGGGKVEIADCTAEPAMVEGWNDAGGRSVLVRSGVVVASAEWGRPGNWAHWLFPDGRQGGVTTTLDEARAAAEAAFPPEPPKPAGWVARSSKGILRWLCIRAVGSYEPKHEPFATREDAQRIADVTGGEAVPVDAAGNVIEALPGVAWEAARAGEEAERLRGELAAVKAERDKVLANAATLDASLRRLRADRDALKASLRDIATTVGAAVSPEASTELHCAVADEVRVVVADLRAERDALAAEVQRARERIVFGKERAS